MTLTHCAGLGAILVVSYAAGQCESNTVQGCTVSYVRGSAESIAVGNNGCGIYIYSHMCNYNTVLECAVDHCGLEGIIVLGGSYNRIANSSVSYCAEAGIRVGSETATGNIVEGNVSFQNAQSVDDRYGIDVIRVANDNVVRYNTVHDQHDTLNDPNISGNNGNPKYGSGGIRFDGGDWADHDYMDSTGNKAYYNLVYNENTGMTSFNFSNIEMYNNVVYHTTVGGIGFISASATISSNNTARTTSSARRKGAPSRGTARPTTTSTTTSITPRPRPRSTGTRSTSISTPGNPAAGKMPVRSWPTRRSSIPRPRTSTCRSGSPCVDRGPPSASRATSKAAVPATRRAPDVGAYELPPPTITVTTPNGGETLTAGTTKTIEWTYTGDPGSSWSASSCSMERPPPELTSTAPSGAGGTGAWAWNIPSALSPGSDYRIRVTSVAYAPCTDSSDAPFSISAPGIAVTSPNGGETWYVGETHAIQWNYTLSPGANVKIELLAGATPTVLAASVALGAGGSGSWSWTIPASQAAASNYRIRVTSTTNAYCTDSSNTAFTIAAPTITVTSPNGGETWLGGQSHALAWTYTGAPGPNVKIELLNAATPTVIAASVSIGASGTGSSTWTVPPMQADGTQYTIRITSTDTPVCADTSNASFTIHPATITVTSPNGGETWLGGETHPITWNYSGNPGANIQIELLNGATPTLLTSGIPITQGTWNWDVCPPRPTAPITAYASPAPPHPHASTPAMPSSPFIPPPSPSPRPMAARPGSAARRTRFSGLTRAIRDQRSKSNCSTAPRQPCWPVA